jgi:hypothetical protein
VSAVEEIESAISKLGRERDERDYHEVNGYLAEVVEGACGGIDDPGYAPLTNDELIVTLHRTIDAQLAILRVGVAFTRNHPHLHDGDILALARAINNTSA